MKRITLLILAAAISTPVLAAPELMSSTIPIPIHGFPTALGFSTQLSRFDKTSGNIVIDREGGKIRFCQRYH